MSVFFGSGRWSIRLVVLLWLIAGSVSAQSTATPPRSRRVFVPIEDLDVVLAGDRRGVLLEKDEFRKLQKLAASNEATRPRVPVPLVLREVLYTARLSGDHLLIDTTVRFHQFARGWQTLSLPLRGVSVERAVLSGRPARMARFRLPGKKGQPTVSGLELFHDRPGPARLELGLSAPLASLGSDKVAAFGLIPAATASLVVHLPAGKHLLVDGLAVRRPAATEKPATYTLPVGGRSEVRLAVTDRRAERSGDKLAFASTAFGIGVAPGEVTWQAVTRLDVFGQAHNRLVATVPRSLEITDVESSGLQGWVLADDPGDERLTQITLDYRQPFTGSRRVVFKGVMTTVVGQLWQVPRLRLPGVTSHVGQVLVQYPPGVRLQVTTASGVRRVAGVVALKGVAAGGGALRFDAWREDFSLSFATETKRQELQAGLATILEIGDQGLDLVAEATIESRFSPLFQVDLSTPVDWNVTGVRVAGKSIPWQRLPDADQRHRLRIGFEKALPEGTEVRVTVLAHRDLPDWPLASDRQHVVPLPDVALEVGGDGNAGGRSGLIVEGTYVIKAPEEYDVVADDLVGLDESRLELTGQRLGYTYQGLKIGGTLRVIRRPVRLSAESLTVARLDRGTLATHYETRLDIQGGGTRTVVIDLPEQAGLDLRFRLLQSPYRIIEQLPAAAIDGRRRWALKFDEFVRGRVSLAVDLTMAREQAAEKSEAVDGTSRTFRLPTLAVIGAERENGYVAIESADDQQIEVDAFETGDRQTKLSEVDPIDLPATTYRPREQIVAAYRYLVAGYRVAVTETRFDHGSVMAAVCHHSTVTSVLARTGEFQHRASFDLTAAGVQSLLVNLGGTSAQARTLWAVTIDGQPIKARRRDEKTFVVSWPTDEAGSGRHSLAIFYKSQVPPLTGSGRLSQTAPLVSLVEGTGREQPPIEVLEQSWTLHHPGQTLVVESEGEFVPAAALDRVSLLGRMKESFRVTSPRNLLMRAVLLLVVLGGLAVLTLAFRRRRYLGLAAATMALLAVGVMTSVIMYSGLRSDMSRGLVQSMAMPTSSEGADFDSAVEMEAAVAEDARSRSNTLGDALPQGRELVEEKLADIAEKSKETPSQGAKPALPAAPGDPGNGPFGGVDPTNRPASESRQPPPPVPTENDEQAASGKPARKLSRSEGAVLSLALEIQPPAGSVSRHFHFLGSNDFPGSEGDRPPAALEIGYQDLGAQATERWFWIVLVVGCCWFLRSRSLTQRCVAAIAAVIGPLALVTVLPVSWNIFLDGLFLGAVAGSGLWLTIGAVGNLPSAWSWCRSRLPGGIVRTGGLLLAVSLMAFSSRTAIAQQPAAKVSAAAKRPPLAKSGLPREVIPFDSKSDPLKASRVLIPQREFLRLWNLAHPDRQVLPAAPRPAVVAGAAWEARVVAGAEGVPNRVAVRGVLQLYSFRDGQVVLSLPLGSVALGGARLDGKPAPVVTRARAAAPLAVVLNGRGAHRLEIEFDVALRQTGPAGRFTVPLLAVPAGRFRFLLPAKDLLVRVNGSTTRHRRSVTDGNESIDIGVDAGGPLLISWQPRQSLAAADGLIQLESYTSVRVADNGVHRRGHYRFRVRQGGLPEVAFELPATVRLQRVSGIDVGGWDLDEVDKQRRLRVFFRRRVTDETSVELELFQDQRVGANSTRLAVDAIRVVGHERDSGLLALFVEDQFAVGVATSTGLKQVDLKQHARPGWISRRPGSPERPAVMAPPQLAFKYISRPFGLALQVRRRIPVATSVARHAVRVEHRKVRIASRIRWHLSQAARSGVTFDLPIDYLPVGVAATGLADWFVHVNDDGRRRLTVKFDAPRTGTVDVVLDGVLPRSPEKEELKLSLPRPLDTGRLLGQLAVWIDEAYTARISSRGGWRSLDPSRVDPDLGRRDPRKARFAFDSNSSSPDPVSLQVTKAIAGLQAAVVTVITVTDTLVDYSLALSWKITQAAADEFVFTTPGRLKGSLQFRDGRIREVRSEPIAADPQGRVRWTITLNEPVRKQLFLIAQATLPPPSANSKSLSAPQTIFERTVVPGSDDEAGGQYQPLATQERYVVLINQSRRQLLREEVPGVERIEKDDLDDVKVRVDRQLFDQATEMLQVASTAATPQWTLASATTEQGTTAEVQLAELVTVLAADGSWRTRASYTIRNRSHQFLAVRMPEKARVLAVIVAGRPSRPVESAASRKENIVLVALPNTSEGDRSFQVVLILSGRLADGPLPRGFHLFADQRRLPVPHVVKPAEDDAVEVPGVFQEFEMPVRRISWSVHVPDDLDVEPIDDEQTNLSLVGSDRLKLNQQHAILDEANYLLNVLEGRASSKAKYKAAANLKGLGTALLDYTSEQRGLRSVQSGNDREDFQRMNEQFQGRYKKALERVKVDQGQQTLTIVDDSGNLAGQDESLQKAQILRNNSRLLRENRDVVQQQGQQQQTGKFAFTLKVPAAKPRPTKGKAGKKNKDVASKKRDTSQLRQKRRSQSLKQAKELNTALENQRALQQQNVMPQQERPFDQSLNQIVGSPGEQSPMGGLGAAGMGGGASGEDGEVALIGDPTAGDTAGGLSVEFDIPTGGQMLQFATTRGGPKLGLAIRPRESIKLGLNLLWTVAWLAVAAGIIVACRRPETLTALQRHFAKGLVGVGLVGFLLLPGLLAWSGFLVFVVGGVTFAVQHRVVRVDAA